MTNVFDGLKGLLEYDAEREAKRQERGSKADWLQLADGETVEIFFLQELDDASPRYSERNGKALFALEHSNPNPGKFWMRVLCTNNEEHDGQCWPCQKNRQMWAESTEANKYNGGWKAKLNMYVNVLVRRPGEEDKVVVLQRTRSKNSYVDDLITDAVEEGYITGVSYKLSRKGEGRDTVYKLRRGKDVDVNVEDYELFDLHRLVREVPYDEQPAALGESVAPPRSHIPADNDPNDDDEWM